MKEYYHYLFGALWILACILLGMYVRGKNISGEKHYAIGLKAILFSYLLGLFLLLAAIVML